MKQPNNILDEGEKEPSRKKISNETIFVIVLVIIILLFLAIPFLLFNSMLESFDGGAIQ